MTKEELALAEKYAHLCAEIMADDREGGFMRRQGRNLAKAQTILHQMEDSVCSNHEWRFFGDSRIARCELCRRQRYIAREEEGK